MKKKTQEKEGNSRNTDEETTDTKENMEKMAADSIENATSEKNQQDPESKGNQAEATSDKVMSEVRAIEEKLAEMQDKYLRLSAEFDNYRKRTLKEKMDLTKYAEEDVLSKIIPFMDDFDRAMQHIDTADGDAMKNGLNLIYAKFSDFLSQNGIKEIDALNTDFNVDLHDAVAKVPVEDESKKGKVVDVVLKGYYLKDRVLRHAKVVVGE
ncbi:MAG TPA: nucleotide exchange factor GrpE [Bacteroidales bacterium]|nr:nucleotide exchange factor GrpE [Bacteroidales bacterium]